MELIIALILFVGIVAAWLVLPGKPTDTLVSQSAGVIGVIPAHHTA